MDWAALRSCLPMFLIDYRGFGSNKKICVLWRCIYCVLLWVLWLERNTRAFEDKCADFGGILDKIVYLASLGGFLFYLISRDWCCEDPSHIIWRRVCEVLYMWDLEPS